jgi:hypothetical protein
MKVCAILQGFDFSLQFLVCLQLYDIRRNSLTVGGIQLLRVGSLLHKKMLLHGDALPVRKQERGFCSALFVVICRRGASSVCLLPPPLALGKTLTELSSAATKFLILLLLIVDSSILISSQTPEEVGHV